MSDMIQGRNGEKILLSEYPPGYMDEVNAAVVESQLAPTRTTVRQ